MKSGTDFFFRDDIKKDTVPIQLMNCIFEDIVLRYTHVRIHEKEGEEAVIKFEYELIEIPDKFSEKKLRANRKFQEHIGLILNSMILDIVEQAEQKNVNNRKNNPPKSD